MAMQSFGLTALPESCLALNCMCLEARDISRLEATTTLFVQKGVQRGSLTVLESATREALNELLGLAKAVASEAEQPPSYRPLWAIAAPALQEMQTLCGGASASDKELLLRAFLGNTALRSQRHSLGLLCRALQGVSFASKGLRCDPAWGRYLLAAASSIDDAGSHLEAGRLLQRLKISLMEQEIERHWQRQSEDCEVDIFLCQVLTCRADCLVNALYSATYVSQSDATNESCKAALLDGEMALRIAHRLSGWRRHASACRGEVPEQVRDEPQQQKRLVALARAAVAFGRASASYGQVVALSAATDAPCQHAQGVFASGAEALELAEKVFRAVGDAESTLWAQACLGELHYCMYSGLEDIAALETSRKLLQGAVDAQAASGRGDTPHAAFAMKDLGKVYDHVWRENRSRGQGELDERDKAVLWLERSRDMYRRLYGEDHPCVRNVSRLLGASDSDTTDSADSDWSDID
eukprot:TRINITY_DN28452_c0_g2_i1.p1 TRINITY_DN28452_c0_g2~~TRINITY_DN28452_c0_g2_i1.p1  ORF type:complete len:468 (-),score=60.68 TRINITY_DN28452_c0_g2_i1:35-1438(-)